MHIFITGGSGRNGSLAITSALERGHTVTALVRSPTSLAPHANLTILAGSPLDAAAVAHALVTPFRAAAVLSTLSLARTGPSPFASLRPDTLPDFLSRAASTLLAAVDAVFDKASATPKIIINSTLGAGDSWGSMSCVFRLLFSQTPMRFGVADHTVVDGLVRASGRRFVLARAGRLTEQKGGDEDKVAAVRVLPDNGKGVGVADALTRQSLARWLIVAAEEDTWDGRSPVLVN